MNEMEKIADAILDYKQESIKNGDKAEIVVYMTARFFNTIRLGLYGRISTWEYKWEENYHTFLGNPVFIINHDRHPRYVVYSKDGIIYKSKE